MQINNAYEKIVEYAHACYYLQFAVTSNTSYRVEEKRMISNQILQNTIEGLKGISRVDFCVLDTEAVSYTHLTLPTIA